MFKLSDFNVTRKETRLSNGIRLVVFERPKAPVSGSVLFLAGGRRDPKGKEGLAHFTEHTIMAGNKRFPTADKRSQYVGRIGGGINAFTSSELMGITFSVGYPSDIKKIISVVYEILFNPLFKTEEFKKVMNTILKEIGRKESNPRAKLYEISKSLLFQETVVESPVLGTKDSLKQINKEDIVSFHKTGLVADSAVITICGGVNIKNIADICEEYLNLPKGARPKYDKSLEIKRKSHTSTGLFKGVAQVYLAISFRTTGNFHKDRVPIGVLLSILGGPISSTLNRRLRIEKGLVYNVSAKPSGFIDGGSFSIITSTSKDKLQEVIDIITNEISNVVRNGVTEEQVQYVKDQYMKSIYLRVQTSGSWVKKHDYRNLVQQDKVWTIEDSAKELLSVTPKSVKKVAQKYLKPNSWYLSMCGDIKKGDVKVNY